MSDKIIIASLYEIEDAPVFIKHNEYVYFGTAHRLAYGKWQFWKLQVTHEWKFYATCLGEAFSMRDNRYLEETTKLVKEYLASKKRGTVEDTFIELLSKSKKLV